MLNTAGGVVRDYSGNWIQGPRVLSPYWFGKVIQAEIWGIYIGLKMAADLQLKHLLVESDSAIAINLLNSTDIDLHPLATIINNFRFFFNLTVLFFFWVKKKKKRSTNSPLISTGRPRNSN